MSEKTSNLRVLALRGIEVLLTDFDGVFDHPMLVWQGDAAFPPLSPDAIQRLRQHLAMGGTLLVDVSDGVPDGPFHRSVQRELRRAVDATADCTGPLVQIALNYSGRQELTDLVRGAVAAATAGDLSPGSIDEEWMDAHLTTRGVADPDLLIRTSGEQRISNFLLWQVAYSEIYFCPVLWPDFSKVDLLKAVLDYQQRERRFGGLAPEDGVFTPVGEPRAE